jgi:hypothetical protein
LPEIDIVLQVFLDVRSARQERPLFGSAIPMERPKPLAKAKPVFNRIVTHRDSGAKLQKQA